MSDEVAVAVFDVGGDPDSGTPPLAWLMAIWYDEAGVPREVAHVGRSGAMGIHLHLSSSSTAAWRSGILARYQASQFLTTPEAPCTQFLWLEYAPNAILYLAVAARQQSRWPIGSEFEGKGRARSVVAAWRSRPGPGSSARARITR